MDVLKLLCSCLITTRNYFAIEKKMNITYSIRSDGDRFKEKERETVVEKH